MHEIHSASSLRSAEEVETWRCNTPLNELPPPTKPIVPLRTYSDEEIPRDAIEQVILRRGSARKFAQVPIGLPHLSTMLDRASRTQSSARAMRIFNTLENSDSHHLRHFLFVVLTGSSEPPSSCRAVRLHLTLGLPLLYMPSCLDNWGVKWI
jgi:hypothetical protein